ncbi:MAG: hypothetical protein WC637_06725 [Victivallales bacterium]|jgi:hypothetical protein
MKTLSITEIKKKARDQGVAQLKNAKKCDIIRSIQAAEGNPQCFATGISETCPQEKCCWRPDCIEAEVSK